jgi:MYXO-CTERM domain-containing protein
MRPSQTLVIACGCVAAVATPAVAEFAAGNQVFIQGVAGPQNGYTYWGTNVDGIMHALGATDQQYFDSFAPTTFVSVSSWVNSPWSVSFSFDFSGFDPGQYSVHAFEIIGLKADGSLASVQASVGSASVQDGIKIRWDGLGSALAESPKVFLTIEQVPAPGALVALAVGGLTAGRRRRL